MNLWLFCALGSYKGELTVTSEHHFMKYKRKILTHVSLNFSKESCKPREQKPSSGEKLTYAQQFPMPT